MQQEAPKEADVKEQDPVEEPAAEVVLPDEEQPLEGLDVDAQVAEWKERAMRATADLDNFRKRMAREKSDALRYANQALLEELLPVLDNFQMGLQAAEAESDSMIFRGMEMVKKQLDDFLSSQGVEEIPADGQMFDHHIHEAVSQEECADAEEGTVLRVIRRGFKMNDRLLRPANVIVAKAPETEEGSTENEEEK